MENSRFTIVKTKDTVELICKEENQIAFFTDNLQLRALDEFTFLDIGLKYYSS